MKQDDLGQAGSRRGSGESPEDYEALVEDEASGSMEELFGLSSVEAREVDRYVNRQIAQSERDVLDARVNFRWGHEQVATVKRAADLIGVPYQTYIKLVVFRQALADIQAAHTAGISE